MDTTDSPHSTICDKPTIWACDNINAERNVSIVVPFFQLSKFTDSDNAKTLSLLCMAVAEATLTKILLFLNNLVIFALPRKRRHI